MQMMTKKEMTPMQNEIIVAVLGMVGTILGSGLGVWASASKTNFRLGQLEKKVEIHNHLIERMTKVEAEVTELQHDVRDLKTK